MRVASEIDSRKRRTATSPAYLAFAHLLIPAQIDRTPARGSSKIDMPLRWLKD